MQGKWSTEYFADLGERVASSALGGVLTMLGLSATDLLASSGEAWLTVVGIPALTSLIKGLLANLKDSESGASLLPAPPGPVVNEDGDIGLVEALLVVVLLLLILTLVGVLC